MALSQGGLIGGCRCCVGPSGATGLSRRTMLRGATAALGAAASGLMCDAPATAAAPKNGIIDVHHHVVPPFYVEENRAIIAASRGGQISPEWLSWSPEAAIEAMDKNGVATGILSYSSPGVWFGKAAEAHDLARRCNDYAMDLVHKYPGRFGLFATIPLPDPDGSLKEIARAFDELKVDGIGIFTSYGDTWLGDPKYDAVFEELNRRKAIVFVHPTTPNCCRTLIPGVAPLIAEVTNDTARAITNLLFKGALRRFRDIRFIFCHGGGPIPMIWGRMAGQATPEERQYFPEGADVELKRLYYDIAGTAYKPALAALTTMLPTSQILFGSDNPFVPLPETAEGLPKLGLPEKTLRAIRRENALHLIPRLA